LNVNDENLKQAILVALGDKEMLKILDVAMLRARSVNDIMMSTGIPHTTSYRKVKWLLEQNLLAIEKITITAEGKKFTAFRTTWRSFNVRYEQNAVIVEGEKNFNPMESTAADFFSLDSV
jgi:hypothetical protein